MKKDDDFFDIAINLAKKSTMQHKHGAIIVRNNEIIGQGINHVSSVMSHSWSCHAEIAAIQNCGLKGKDKQKLGDATLLVVRVANDGTPKLSKPCSSCTKQIQKLGIKKVFYSV